jgi:hypothetical protein
MAGAGGRPLDARANENPQRVGPGRHQGPEGPARDVPSPLSDSAVGDATPNVEGCHTGVAASADILVLLGFSGRS